MLKTFSANISQAFNVLLPSIASGVAALILLLYFHNISWYAPDEGVFGHFADRINRGEIHGVDYDGVHPGYHSLLNAFLFNVFGRDLVVLRYPLVLLAVMQSVMTSYMLRRQGGLCSFVGGVWICCFSFLQYLTPSPNSYCYFLAFFCIFVLAEFPKSYWRLIVTGFLVGLCVGMRHPSGVLLGAGVVAYLIVELHPKIQLAFTQTQLSRFLLLIVMGVFAYYSIFMYGKLDILIYLGVWPLFIAGMIFIKYPAENRDLMKALLYCSIGGCIALLPLIGYQLLYGDIIIWWKSTVTNTTFAMQRDPFHAARYWSLPLTYSHINVLGLAYGLLIYLLAPYIGFVVCKRLYGEPLKAHHPALVIPFFFGYVSMYYQIPFYLYCSFGLFGLALLVSLRSEEQRKLITGTMAFMIAFAVIFHMGKPWTHVRSDERAELPGVSLYITDESKQTYTKMVDFILAHSDGGDSIFAYPQYPELYYMTQRRNPTPYVSTAVSVNSESAYEKLLHLIHTASPAIVITNPEDKYYGEFEKRFTAALTSDLGYNLVEKIQHFHIYMKE